MSMTPTIHPETPADFAAISEVNRLAFGREGEASLVSGLRDGGYALLSLVAEVDGQVVGHIMFSRQPIITDSGVVEAVALAVMAVLPTHQRQGIGSRLVEAGLKICTEQGHRIVTVVGHPKFYPRFGFSTELAKRLDGPCLGAAWMALELVPGALAGVTGEAEEPPPFRYV